MGYLSKLTGAGTGLWGAHKSAIAKQLQYIETILEEHSKNVIALTEKRMAGASGNIGQQLADQIKKLGTEQKLRSALNELTNEIQHQITATPKASATLFETNLNRVQKGLIRIASQDRAQYTAFSEYLNTIARLGKRAARVAGVASIGVPLAIGGYQIAQDWNSPNRMRTVAKVGGNLAGGAIFGAAGYQLCTFVFFGFTGGTSPLWCGLVVGGLAGFAGSEITERKVDRFFDLRESKPGMLIESEKCWVR